MLGPDWYSDAVRYVFENGLMVGTSDDTFDPEVATSRAMMVTVLHRLAGTSAPSAPAFTAAILQRIDERLKALLLQGEGEDSLGEADSKEEHTAPAK